VVACGKLLKEGRTGFFSLTVPHSKDRPVCESVTAIRCVGFYLVRVVTSLRLRD
jgi:hypothetical protein